MVGQDASGWSGCLWLVRMLMVGQDACGWSVCVCVIGEDEWV